MGVLFARARAIVFWTGLADNKMAEANFLWERTVRTDTRWVAFTGYAAIVAMSISFGFWAVSAPLAGSVIAPGVIAAAGRNIPIQHLEGGIVKDLLVSEGDKVKTGQELIVLDPMAARAQLNRLEKQKVALEAMSARLVAERDSVDALPDISFQASYPSATKIQELVEEQRKEFVVRLSRYQSEKEILHQRLASLRETLEGLQSHRRAVDDQLTVVMDELGRKKSLVDRGLSSRFEYTQILRHQADLTGQRAVKESEIAATRAQIAEANEQIERLKTQRVEEAVTKLNEVRTSLADMEEQILAAGSILDRTIIRAPTDGIVVSSVYNSKGSVIAPGEKVMDILPTTHHLIVDARLPPRDVDVVRVGQPARLHLSALNARLTPEVAGSVLRVSADRLIDEVTREPYYRATLEITEDLPNEVSREQLYPGMPVEAFISTGDRTFFEYLLRPVLDSFRHAFTEE